MKRYMSGDENGRMSKGVVIIGMIVGVMFLPLPETTWLGLILKPPK